MLFALPTNCDLDLDGRDGGHLYNLAQRFFNLFRHCPGRVHASALAGLFGGRGAERIRAGSDEPWWKSIKATIVCSILPMAIA